MNRLHEMSKDNADLETRLRSLAKGIGQVTVNIFLREMRGIWKKANPFPGDLAAEAARNLGLIPKPLSPPGKILVALKELWKACEMPGMDFTDFEAALVRSGIENRRKRAK